MSGLKTGALGFCARSSVPCNPEASASPSLGLSFPAEGVRLNPKAPLNAEVLWGVCNCKSRGQRQRDPCLGVQRRAIPADTRAGLGLNPGSLRVKASSGPPGPSGCHLTVAEANEGGISSLSGHQSAPVYRTALEAQAQGEGSCLSPARAGEVPAPSSREWKAEAPR